MSQPQEEGLDTDQQLAIYRYAILATLFHLTYGLAYYISTPSALAPTTQKDSAAWTKDNTNALIDFLYERRATSEGSNFKSQVFQEAASRLEKI